MEKNILAGKTALPPFMLPGAIQTPSPQAPWALQWSEPDRSLQNLMHARFYGSSIARFLRPDPINGNPANPQSWNLYAYVRNNPVNATDPTGLMVNLTTAFKARLDSDPLFKKAFDFLINSKLGSTQWKEMTEDKTTVYNMDVKTLDKLVFGLTLPRDPDMYNYIREEGKIDSKIVNISLDVEQRETNEKIFGRSDKDIVKELAKDLFHENCHGLDFGSARLFAKEVWERWINLDKLVVPGHLPAIDDTREVQFMLELDNMGK